MADISTKLTYLDDTKTQIKNAINNAGANITNDIFRSYATTLNTRTTKMRSDRDTLLGNSTIGTSTGNISNALDYPIYENKLTKESTQSGTPTPTNEVEVNTVKGYRNLFDKNDTTKQLEGFVSNSVIQSYNNNLSIYIEATPGKTYTVTKKYGTSNMRMATSSVVPILNSDILSNENLNAGLKFTYTMPSGQNYLVVFVQGSADLNTYTREEILSGIQIIEGATEKPYVPYGTNWIAITNTDGTDTNYYTIPLNNNEIVGIGTYLDELIIDKNGHCWLNKKTGKVTYKGTESWGLYSAYTVQPRRFGFENRTLWTQDNMPLKSNYFVGGLRNSQVDFEIWTQTNYIVITDNGGYWNSASDFKTWLSTHNTVVYYPIATDNLIDLNYNVDITLFKGNNTITNSENMDMAIKYVEDVESIMATLFTLPSE